jgi:tRNA modification GTPase
MSGAQPHAREVIVAVASAPGRSASLVVRASGPGASDALRRVDSRMPAGSMRRGVRAGELELAIGRLPCLVLTTPGPASYTGEDAFELLLPGHPALGEIVVCALERAGLARRAAPGEFTLRAFETGRLTLEQAEGVAATIAARTDAELHAAAMLRAGVIGRGADAAAEAVADLLALVEAGIDFTDQEDVVAIAPADLRVGIDGVTASLRSMLQGAVSMERLESAPWVVLCGAPNAGKSALFNALLGRARAVVADVAGTTRDALVEPWRLDGPDGPVEVLLVDAPGVDGNVRGLDALGQRMREEAMRRACVRIECSHEGGSSWPTDPSAIRVQTQSDRASFRAVAGWLATSAITGEGLDTLRARVAAAVLGLAAPASAEGVVLAERHRALLHEAVSHLEAALAAVGCGRALAHPELVAAAMHGALESLGGVAGRIAPDDILGRIFGRFCVGK